MGNGSPELKTLRSFLHEIKTPLATIVGYLDLLAHRHPGVEGRREEIYGILQRNARRLHHLLDLLHEWLLLRDPERRSHNTSKEEVLQRMEKDAPELFRILKGAQDGQEELLLFPKLLFFYNFLQKFAPEPGMECSLKLEDRTFSFELAGEGAKHHLPLMEEVAESLGGKVRILQEGRIAITFATTPLLNSGDP